MPDRGVPVSALPDPAAVVGPAGVVRSANDAFVSRADLDAGDAVEGTYAGVEALTSVAEGEREGVDLRPGAGGPALSVTATGLPDGGTLVTVDDRAELAADSSMLDALLEHVPVSVYFKDRRGRHVRVSDAISDEPAENAEGKVHPAPADFVGKTDFDLYPPQVAEPAFADDRAVIEDGETIHNREERLTWPSGETVWHTSSKVPWYDEEGSVQGLVGVTVDVTERKANELELERQNERLEAFASVVSHDLRNPLDVASGALALYRETGDADHLDRIERMHARMAQLIEDTLALARSGERVTDREAVDLAEVVADAWGSVDTGRASLAGDPEGTVQADRGRLRRLFANLFRNAVEHAATEPAAVATEGGAVQASAPSVTVTVGETPAGFFVADDGPGIPPEERDQVFDHGFSTGEDGTGFGLSIVSEIAEAHGWDVEVTESEAGGARFEIETRGE